MGLSTAWLVRTPGVGDLKPYVSAAAWLGNASTRALPAAEAKVSLLVTLDQVHLKRL